MKFICDQKQNMRLSHVLCTYLCFFMLFLLLRVKLFSHIVILCVVFLTLVSCFNNIKIKIQSQNPRSTCPIGKCNSPSNSGLSSGVYLACTRTSFSARPLRSLVRRWFTTKSYSLQSSSVAEAAVVCAVTRMPTIILQGRSAATPQLPPNMCCTNTNQHIQGGTQSASHLASTLIALQLET